MNLHNDKVEKIQNPADALSLELKKELQMLHNFRQQAYFTAFVGGLAGGALVVLLYVIIQFIKSAAS